jgi:hypothetical protein
VHNYITEFLGSRIASDLGYDVQNVDLVVYEGRKCALIEHLGYAIISMGEEGESTVSGSKQEVYSLSYMLKYSEVNKKFGVSKEAYKRWAVRLFLLDIFLDNRDRHGGNWGFYRDSNGDYKLAALFDFGACLSPRLVCDNESLRLAGSFGAIREAVKNGVRLATPINGRKRNGTELLRNIHSLKEFKSMLEEETIYFNDKIKKLNIEPLLKTIEDFGDEYTAYVNYARNLISYKIQRGIVL